MSSDKKGLIFVVDDNTTNLSVVEDALFETYRVISLSSAEQMFKALNKFMPDIILLDILMPGMSGFEAISKLKCDERYCAIPVVFLTSSHDAQTVEQGTQLGAAGFIPKPFNETALKADIEKYLEA